MARKTLDGTNDQNAAVTRTEPVANAPAPDERTMTPEGLNTAPSIPEPENRDNPPLAQTQGGVSPIEAMTPGTAAFEETAETGEPAAPKQDSATSPTETTPGGRYRTANGNLVDARGQVIKD